MNLDDIEIKHVESIDSDAVRAEFVQFLSQFSVEELERLLDPSIPPSWLEDDA